MLLVPTIAGYGISVGNKSGSWSHLPACETSNVKFLDELLFLFGHPPGSGFALLCCARCF